MYRKLHLIHFLSLVIEHFFGPFTDKSESALALQILLMFAKPKIILIYFGCHINGQS